MNWSILLVLLLLVCIALQLVMLLRKPGVDVSPVQARLDAFERGQERGERALRDELARMREEAGAHAHHLRGEVGAELKEMNEQVLRIWSAQKNVLDGFAAQIGNLAVANEQRMDLLRAGVEAKLEQVRADNAQQLERMRHTVDEKLQGALEQRLGESFRLVSERLELVHRGLGEMQSLATGVGDLKRVLTNVKVRGTWGEVQLGALLEQVLTPDQYVANAATNELTGHRVEFAVKLPGRDDDGVPVLLPIDAKFPHEDYLRLVEAQENADAAAAEAASRQLEASIRASAREISDKYLNPPRTTDFAILFLPTEGLYAEAIRRPGLLEAVQRDSRVMIAGPTTLSALLTSLQMGFRTLAIQKRSGEIWKLLGAVKTEFGKFEEVLTKVQKKLQEASNQMGQAGVRTRAIQRRLSEVQELPALEATAIIGDELQIARVVGGEVEEVA